MRAGILRGAQVAAVVAVSVLAVPSAAQAADLSIPLDTVIDGGVAEGAQVELTTVAADVLTGRSCAMTAVHGGSDAVHPGNDLVVTSGQATARLVDVERSTGATTEASGALVLGEVIRVDLVMGPDEQFSGDVVLELDCDGTAVAAAATSADTSARSATDASGPSATDQSALPVTGPWTTGIGLVLGTLLVIVGYGLTVLARSPEQS